MLYFLFQIACDEMIAKLDPSASAAEKSCSAMFKDGELMQVTFDGRDTTKYS